MWARLKDNFFIFGALSGSLATYLLSLFVTHFRREKRWLGYQVSSRNVVQRGHSKVTMTYEGREIARLDSHSIQVRNIGNRALVGLPVRLHCGEGGRIVEHELAAPEGVTLTGVLEDDRHLIVHIDLLNPGETFTVGLTVADAKSHAVKVVARGEYLELREIGEREDSDDLIKLLMPRLPLIGNFAFDLYKVARSRGRRRSRTGAVVHEDAAADRASPRR